MDLKQQFSKKIAIRISVASTLSLLIVLAIPYHPAIWFGWFAPFSVIINMLMFPYQNHNHAIFWERLISISATTLFAYVLLLFFWNNLVLYCVIIFLFSLWCMYCVGNHHRYHYGFFLAMIFAALSVGFALSGAMLTQTLWQFPAAVAVGFVSLVLTDFFLSAKTATKHIENIKKYARQQFLKHDLQHSLATYFFHHWRTHLQQSKSHYEAPAYELEARLSYLNRILVQKHNVIVKYLTEVVDPEIKQQIIDCHQTLKQVMQGIVGDDVLQNQLAQLDDKINQAESPENAALICSNELHLSAEDIQHLRLAEQGKTDAFIIPKTSIKHHTGFNLDAFNFSLRTMLAIGLSTYLVLALNLPGSIQAIVATMVTAASPNAGATVLKMLMRFGGIITGTVAGFFTLMILSQTHSLGLYLLLFGLFIYAASWSSLNSERYGYTGIQAALLFLIMSSSTGTQAINISLATQRFEGVLVGSLIAFTVVFIISPKMPSKILKRQYQQLRQQLQMLWQAMLIEAPQITQLKIAAAEIDNLLTQAKELADAQRFLLTDSINHQKILENLQGTVDMLKQLIRLLESGDTQLVQQWLIQYPLDFISNQAWVNLPSKENILNRYLAKAQHCITTIQHEWAAFLQEQGKN